MSDDVLTVGQTVARARAAAGLTVEQVAGATRIRSTLVRAIENDDFALCGGDVYARGHLKSIATAVGLDPAEVVALFDAERGAVRPPVVEGGAPEPARAPERAGAATLGALAAPLGGTVEGRRGGGTNWTAVMALALAVIVGVAAISALNNRSAAPVAEPTFPAATTPVATPSATASPSETPPASPTPSPTDAVAEADGVTVVLDVTGKAAWVRVTGGTSKETLYEGTLTKGQTKTFRDSDQINLVIGDAGAVTLTVNGQDLGKPGGSGQVVKLEFVPGDPTGQAG